MASKAINQNDLIDIIKANVEVVTDTLNIIKNSDISSVYKTYSEFKKNADKIVKYITYIKDILLANIFELNNMIIETQLLNKIKLNNSLYNTIIDSIFYNFEIVNTMINNINKIPVLERNDINVNYIIYIITSINNILAEINKIKINKNVLKNLILWKVIINRLKSIISYMNNIGDFKNDPKNITDKLNELKKQIVLISNIFDTISNINNRKISEKIIKNNINIILIISDNINKIDKIKIGKRIENKLNIIKNIVLSIGTIIGALLLLVPLMALFIVASPVIILCFGLFIIVFNIIIRMSRFLLNPKTELSLLKLRIFGVLFGLLFIEFVLIAFIAGKFIEGIPNIIKGIIGITIISLAIGALGFMLSLISPVLISAVIGIGILTIAVGAILLIAGALWLLQHVELDKNAILDNINMIMDVSISIIVSLFESPIIGGKKTDNIFIKILKAFGGGIATVALSIVGAAMLVSTLASVAAMLALIHILKQFQYIKGFNSKNIKKNIKDVISTALEIINSLFVSDETKETPSNKTWLESVLKWMGNTVSGIGSIINGILSIGFLSVAFISVGMIWMMKTILMSLQDIGNFNKEDIIKNVKNIIGTALEIINSLFVSDETKETPSDKTWLESFFEWASDSWLGRVIKGAGSIINGILSVGFLSVALASVGMIWLMKKALTSLQDMGPFNKDIIIKNVQNIIEVARSVTDAIFNPVDQTSTQQQIEQNKTNEENKNWLESIFDWVGDKLSVVGDTVKAISSLGYLSTMIASVGLTHKLASQLDSINKIGDLSKVIVKTNDIIRVSNNIITSLLDEKNSINKINIKQLNKIVVNSQKVLNILNILKSVNNIIDKFTDISDKQVENNSKLLNNYIKFINKINDVKIDNLSKATNMFKEMARLSESIDGNFEGLAESLNEKIAPLLEQLKDILSKIPDNIKTSSDNIGQSISNNAAGPAGWNASIIKQNANNYAEEDRDEIMKEMERRSMESKADNTRIVEVLNDILDVMTGNGAYSEGVKTY